MGGTRREELQMGARGAGQRLPARRAPRRNSEEKTIRTEARSPPQPGGRCHCPVQVTLRLGGGRKWPQRSWAESNEVSRGRGTVSPSPPPDLTLWGVQVRLTGDLYFSLASETFRDLAPDYLRFISFRSIIDHSSGCCGRNVAFGRRAWFELPSCGS